MTVVVAAVVVLVVAGAGAALATVAVSPTVDDAALEQAAWSTATAVITASRPTLLSTRAMLARAVPWGGARPQRGRAGSSISA